jgi:hypothetical protein
LFVIAVAGEAFFLEERPYAADEQGFRILGMERGSGEQGEEENFDWSHSGLPWS